ncbi:hypothetical protein GCM10027440_05370 [Nocardiopsis coralliicola]
MDPHAPPAEAASTRGLYNPLKGRPAVCSTSSPLLAHNPQVRFAKARHAPRPERSRAGSGAKSVRRAAAALQTRLCPQIHPDFGSVPLIEKALGSREILGSAYRHTIVQDGGQTIRTAWPCSTKSSVSTRQVTAARASLTAR